MSDNIVKGGYSFFMNPDVINAALDELKKSRSELADVDQQLYEAIHDLVYANGCSYVTSLDQEIDLNKPEKLIEICRDSLDGIVNSMSQNISFMDRYDTVGDYNDNYVNSMADNMNYDTIIKEGTPMVAVASASLQQCVYGPAPSYSEVVVDPPVQVLYGVFPTTDPDPSVEPIPYNPDIQICVYGPAPSYDPVAKPSPPDVQILYGVPPVTDPDVSFDPPVQVLYGVFPSTDPDPSVEPSPYNPDIQICVYGPAPSYDPVVKPEIDPEIEVVYGPPPTIDDVIDVKTEYNIQCVYGPAPAPSTIAPTTFISTDIKTNNISILDEIKDSNTTPVTFKNYNDNNVNINTNDVNNNNSIINEVRDNSNTQPIVMSNNNNNNISYNANINNDSNVIKMEIKNNPSNLQSYVPISNNTQPVYDYSTSAVQNSTSSVENTVINDSTNISNTVSSINTNKLNLGELDTSNINKDLMNNNSSLENTDITKNIEGNRPSNSGSNSRIGNSSQSLSNSKINISTPVAAGVGALGLAGVASIGAGASIKKKEKEREDANEYHTTTRYINNNAKEESLLDE